MAAKKAFTLTLRETPDGLLSGLSVLTKPITSVLDYAGVLVLDTGTLAEYLLKDDMGSDLWSKGSGWTFATTRYNFAAGVESALSEITFNGNFVEGLPYVITRSKSLRGGNLRVKLGNSYSAWSTGNTHTVVYDGRGSSVSIWKDATATGYIESVEIATGYSLFRTGFSNLGLASVKSMGFAQVAYKSHASETVTAGSTATLRLRARYKMEGRTEIFYTPWQPLSPKGEAYLGIDCDEVSIEVYGNYPGLHIEDLLVNFKAPYDITMKGVYEPRISQNA